MSRALQARLLHQVAGARLDALGVVCRGPVTFFGGVVGGARSGLRISDAAHLYVYFTHAQHRRPTAACCGCVGPIACERGTRAVERYGGSTGDFEQGPRPSRLYAPFPFAFTIVHPAAGALRSWFQGSACFLGLNQ
jgi:hypothetical protein